MRPIKRILVAVKDPAAQPLPAITKAAQLARALGAQIELFHVMDAPILVDPLDRSGGRVAQFDSDSRKRCLQQIEERAARLRSRRFDVSTAVEWDFPAHEAITRRAAAIEADLIVAECHRGSHHASWLLHATDWELLRASAVPVLLVKTPRPYHRPVVLASLDPARAHAKPADLDTEILRVGGAVSDALRGALHAVHAYFPVPQGLSPEVLANDRVIADLEADAAAHAAIDFDQVLSQTDLPDSRRHLVGSDPSLAIPAVARTTGSSIVVMGAVPRAGLKGFFIGSTVERVADQLTCDLLVVKTQSLASSTKRARRRVRFTTAVPLP